MKKQGEKSPSPCAERKTVTSNRKAYHDYEVTEKFETGVALVGTEVKSIWLEKTNLQDSHCEVDNGELWAVNWYIAPYEKGGLYNVENRRKRKLLMHKREILRLDAKVKEKGLTIIPLSVYFKRGKVKLEIGLARGKKQYDKREQIAQKDSRREQERENSHRRQ